MREESVDVERLKAELTVTNPAYWQQKNSGFRVTANPELRLWEEGSDGTILVPRHYEVPWTVPHPHIVSLRGEVDLDDHVWNPWNGTLRDEVQETSVKALTRDNRDKILSLACGKGKTVVSLCAASRGNRFPVLVVVHTQALMSQWVERIEQFYGAHTKIGVTQGPKCEWGDEYQFGVAMLQTLCLKALPPEFYEHWRLIIFDEVHRLGAEFFSKACSMFPGERWGLSATVEREDKADKVFRMHLGEVAYRNLEQPLKPIVYFVSTAMSVDIRKYIIRGVGRVNMGQLHTVISENEDRNKLVSRYVMKLVNDGRTILILGERRAQLGLLCDEYKSQGIDASLCLGGMKEDERATALKSKVVLATQQLVKEGLDRPEFDTLISLTPFGGKGRLDQTIGRILRISEGKKTPKVFIFVDRIGIMESLASGMAKKLKNAYTVVKLGAH